MKVDSMDASNVTFAVNKGASSSNISTKAEETKDPVVSEIGSKNVSQITAYDKKELPASEKFIIDAIEKANKAITGSNREFEVSIHEKTKDIMVKVIDTETKEVIREFPPKKIMDLIAKIWEMAGIMVDERR